MPVDSDTILSIFAIILLIVVSIMLGCQYMSNRTKKRKMKWTCGVEGGCEMTMHGSYDSKQQCEEECSSTTENYNSLQNQIEEMQKNNKEELNKQSEFNKQSNITMI